MREEDKATHRLRPKEQSRGATGGGCDGLSGLGRASQGTQAKQNSDVGRKHAKRVNCGGKRLESNRLEASIQASPFFLGFLQVSKALWDLGHHPTGLFLASASSYRTCTCCTGPSGCTCLSLCPACPLGRAQSNLLVCISQNVARAFIANVPKVNFHQRGHILILKLHEAQLLYPEPTSIWYAVTIPFCLAKKK